MSMHTHLTFVFLYSLIFTLHFLLSQVKNPLCLSAKTASVKVPDLQAPCSGPNSGLCRDRQDAFVWSLSQCWTFSGTGGLFCDQETLIYLRIPHSTFWITFENSNGALVEDHMNPYLKAPGGVRSSLQKEMLCVYSYLELKDSSKERGL